MTEHLEVKLCSGYGQHHSPNAKLNPKPYATVTLNRVRELLAHPAEVDKSDGQWAIFSELLSRNHSEQRQHGKFYALWSDIDESQGLTFDDIVSRSSRVIPGDCFAYTSKSATEDNQKARITVPTAYAMSGHEFVIWQKVLNDKLEAAGIKPDRVTERAGQLCYLPNRGEFYDFRVIEGKGLLNPDESWPDELAAEMQRQQEEQAEIRERRELAKIKAKARVSAGTHSPIDAFTSEYAITLMFDTYGFLQKGSNRWLSPNSNSNSPAVSLTADGRKWLSAHDSDSEMGRPCDSGNGVMGDAFDLYVYFEHQGNRDAALKAVGDMFTVNGVSMNQANQDRYREAQRLSDVAPQNPVELPASGEGQAFSLDAFSLNGMAAEMESKMLEDKFILGRMAILGQSTVFYAKPNAGKTLVTIWLLIEAIKKGEIDAKDVFYINADDNHKGLTYKLKLAERHGFNMLAPGYKGFRADMLADYLAGLVAQESASGKILILDTVKKFTDIMRKDVSSKFGESVRQFVSHGGSVIMLAHVNKHKDDEGKVVYSGTTDLVDDADCAYTLDVVTDDKASGQRTVKFENFKSRGDVALDAVYSYDYSEGRNYYERLESVRAVSDDEREAAEKQKQLDARLEINRDAIEAIKDVLREGSRNKTELVKAAHESSGVSRKRIQRALTDHTGKSIADCQYWHVDVQDKNAHVYKLNWGM
jgi:hypothetical protein